MSNEKANPKDFIMFLIAIILAMPVTAIACDVDSCEGGIFGTFLALVFWGLEELILVAIKNHKIEKENRKKQYSKNSAEFYQIAKRNGISYPLEKTQIPALKAVAEKHGISAYTCEAMFQNGYDNLIKIQKREEAILNNRIAKEIHLVGSSKYVQGLVDAFVEDYAAAESVMKHMDNYLELKARTRAQQHSWSIAGGLAQGLGGPALGMATAIDIQNWNREQQELAAQTRQRAYESIGRVSGMNQEIVNAANKVSYELRKFDKDLSQAIVLEQNGRSTRFSVNSMEIRESGTMLVNVSPRNKELDSGRILDGIIRIIIKVNGVAVGNGYLTSPGYLSKFDDETEKEIEKIGLENMENKNVICFPFSGYSFNPNVKYEAVFEEINVWYINKEMIESNYSNALCEYNSYTRIKAKRQLDSLIDVLSVGKP